MCVCVRARVWVYVIQTGNWSGTTFVLERINKRIDGPLIIAVEPIFVLSWRVMSYDYFAAT